MNSLLGEQIKGQNGFSLWCYINCDVTFFEFECKVFCGFLEFLVMVPILLLDRTKISLLASAGGDFCFYNMGLIIRCSDMPTLWHGQAFFFLGAVGSVCLSSTFIRTQETLDVEGFVYLLKVNTFA